MKPRLIALLPTVEDMHIIGLVHRSWDIDCAVTWWRHCNESDRRDADLMLRVQTNRWAEIRDDGALFDVLPPWLLPMAFNCGPVGGDIERYITSCA